MGNKKNRANPHISRGKYKKQFASMQSTQDTSLATVSPSTIPIQGSHIVNMDRLASFIADVSTHSQSCSLGTVFLAGESYRGGLASILTAKCTGCRAQLAFPTSPRVTTIGGARSNLAAVWGQMATGGGHAPLEEAMSILGIPVMTKKTFVATEKEISQQWRSFLDKSMVEAAEEEKRIAINKGSYHEGVPASVLL